ncbi:MAG: hypothetical protein NXI24_15460 [bacterium]|nr:hypothetical protein [bacterium]
MLTRANLSNPALAPAVRAALLLFFLAAIVGSGACLRPWIRDNAVPLDRNDLPLRVEKLRGFIFVVEDYNYWKTNQVIYAHPEGVYFFDATWTYKGARQMIWKGAANSYADFRGVVLTGFPLHRTGGLSTFRGQGVRIIAQRRTGSLLRSHWANMQAEMSASFDTWRPLPFQPPDGVFDEQAELLGGRVRVLHMPPAYSPDNSVVLFTEERVLYGGSLLSSPLMLTDFADLSHYEAALDRIAELEFDTVIAGHGGAIRDRSILDEIRTEVRLKRQKPAK